MAETKRTNDRIDVDSPRWQQDTFLGRLKYFASISDFRTAFVSDKQLSDAKELLEKYKSGREPVGTTDDQVYHAQKLYRSAIHPDTGDLQNVIGRMSFQVPGGMIITVAMLHFYRTNTGVIVTQWLNQSFNVLVNYTNRNAGSSLSYKQIALAYTSATASALVTALGLKSYLASRASPLFQRFVPFLAVSAANIVNIPLTRQDELLNGVTLVDENNNPITKSRYAAAKGISQVVSSRTFMAAPGMLILPIIMEKLEKQRWFRINRWFHLPFQAVMIGTFLSLTVPVGCALFPQKSSITMSRLNKVEPDRYEEVIKHYGESKIPRAALLQQRTMMSAAHK
ncbi:hypothetical protein LSH36_356g02000 [Paralvinella palmiformis]|uniref:Sidoreflexin n=1 Tax=Paralvinella palmiformis TaxID=53620 RepID=A0AAD9MZX7_9ANNE|nr:hypothetical protein LSH36_356g02000 [Paralvinella palmiformis]